MWLVRLELCFSGENYSTTNGFRREELEKPLDRAHVSLILSQRILEPGAMPIEHLSPLAIFRRAEDPTAVILRFDNKNAKSRDEDVIDLG